jgi:hypothetical protein
MKVQAFYRRIVTGIIVVAMPIDRATSGGQGG